MVLSQEAFNKLTKAEAYAVYMELHQRYKDSEATNKQLLNQQEVLHRILYQQKAIFKCVVDKPDVVVPSTAANCNDAPAQNLKVRSFQTRQIANTTTNLILVSSTVAKVNQNELPLNVEIIPYSGSTTDEKMTILQKTNFVQLKTIKIQDGTNSILMETNKSPEEIAINIKALISQIYEKFKPQKIFICEIPPVVENLDDENPLHGVNDKIDQVNVLLKDMFTCSDVYSFIPHSTMLVILIMRPAPLFEKPPVLLCCPIY